MTAFCSSPDGRIYAVTGNIGSIVSIGPGREASGTYESDVFDAGAFTYWGRLSEEGTGTIAFETRSGNLNRPQQNWSPWAKLNAGRTASPAARFLQYRATLSGTAELTEIDLAYQMKNVAPVVEAVEITPENYKFPAPAGASSPSNPTLTLPAMRTRPPSASTVSIDSGSSPALNWSKGQIGSRWLANDDNGDTMSFKIEIRGVNETGWKLLHD